YRRSLEAIRGITIGAKGPGGNGVAPIPLSDVADVKLVSGAAFIYRENQERYIPIKFSVRGRDLGGAVLDAQRRVAKAAPLPSGYRMEWVGELGDLQNAMGRLALAIPLSLALIVLLLFVNFSSLTDTLLAASVLPMAMIGGILALRLTGAPLSVSAAIGFIGLFGISVMNAILVVAAFNRLIDTGYDRAQAVLQACQGQFRPVLMTSMAACVGLLPAAISTGIGSQVQRPLALVVVGGVLLAPVFILTVLPVLVDIFGRSRVETLPDGEPALAPAE
ncbi:MAG TPA: efflux RND transporter permease subunit, partial [Caulobacteraceae bacterium]